MSRFLFLFSFYSVFFYFVRSYEFGYHPSAEEFDNTWRDKTWTRSILRKDREQKKFTPKYNSEPKHKKHNRDTVFNNNYNTKPLLETNFDFESEVGAEDNYFSASSNIIKVYTNHFDTNITESVQNQSINFDQIKNLPKFPIYFTNPVTGILYSISEVGYNKNATKIINNGTIPIYITKEQYDRDIELLKQSYNKSCHTPNFNVKLFNKTTTTKRPLIKYLKNKPVNKIAPHRNNRTTTTLKPKIIHSTRATNKKSKISRPHSNLNKLDTPTIIQGNRTHSLIKYINSNLDTQVEKPHNENSTPTLPTGTTAFSLLNKPLKQPNNTQSIKSSNPQKKKSKRTRRSLKSLKFSQNKNLTNVSMEHTQRSSVNSSKNEDYNQKKSDASKSKKHLSTQIHVTTSEYVEPIKIENQKNSDEVKVKLSTTSTISPKINKPMPCSHIKNKVEMHDEDYYNFGDFSYKDDDDDYGYSDELDDSIYSSSSTSIEDELNPIDSDENKINPPTNKRVKRLKNDEEYYDDYDYDGTGGVMEVFRGMFMPVQMVMEKVFMKAGHWLSTDNDNDFDEGEGDTSVSGYINSIIDKRKPKFPKYTIYNNELNSANGGSSAGGSLISWLSSWFSPNQNDKIDLISVVGIPDASTTNAPSTTVQPGWLESWWGDEKTPETYDADDYGKWFLGWFDTGSKTVATPAPITTTPVPILTIADPLKNPQKWIGILAQHIVNSSTTARPPSVEEIENAIPAKVSYDKFQIWRLKPQDDTQVHALNEYKQSEEGSEIQWLMGPSLRGLTDVVVPPKLITDFQGTLSFENIEHEVLIYDVGKAIFYEESKEKLNLKRPLKHGLAMTWSQYYDYDHIILYLEQMQMKNAHLVELIHIGRSYEGRPLILVKIEKVKEESVKKKKTKLKQKLGQDGDAVFIEAGVYGREWIGPATATWIINELLKIMKSNRTSLDTEYIRNTTWYVLPVLNPDSYVYSHEFDRMWKKSRSKNIAQPNGIISSALTWLQQKKSEKTCFGVDLNRNWDHEWGKQGSSNLPCNEFYGGKNALSEPETKALSKFIMDNRKQIKLFISFQSYGQVISYPRKIGSSLSTQKWDDLLDVAMVGIDGLRKHGSTSRYKIDSTNDLIAHKTGSSDSFALFEAGIPFSYTIYLGDNGVHGYLLPPSYIEPIARDTFEIITAIIDYF